MLPFSIINQYGNIIQRNDYERFILELQSTSTDKLVTYNQSYSQINGTSYNRVYMYGTASVSGTMWGTSYGNKMTWDSSFFRVIQHCFPTQALYNDFIASTNNSRVVCLVRSATATGTGYVSLARNGYTSSAYASFTGCTITQFIYFDPNTSRVMTYNPSLGDSSTPTYYYY